MDFFDEVEKNVDDKYLKTFVKMTPILPTGKEMGIEDYYKQGNLSDEIFHFIERRFEVDDEAAVRSYIDEYIRKQTMFSLVECDWRTPIFIAHDLNLSPKNVTADFVYMEGHLMIQDVIMQKIGKEWKVKKYKTIALSRWDQEQLK